MALPMLMIVFWKFSLLGMGLYFIYDIFSTYSAVQKEIEEEELTKEINKVLRK